jgi:RTX calcium-binding nonapeptide repeat (4 copies)
MEKYMGQTGGRSDIGPLTQWAAMYLVSQDPRALEIMMAQADAGGSIPWHFRDEATGDYVRIDLNPNLWIDYRATGSQSVAGGYTSPGGGWSPELAHQPSLSYVPYLITGTRYYLDELQAQASFVLAAAVPEYRGYDQGLKGGGQVRGLAWGLRDIADAMYLTPENDPMHGYFETILDRNLARFVDMYITNGTMDSAKELEGYFKGEYGTPGAMAPWQQDYLVMALGRMAAQGSEDASALLGWMTNFIAGRFINGDYGYNPLYGPAYNLYLGTNPLYSTWDQAYDASIGTTVLTEMEGYPTWAGGYAAGAKGALATLITETHKPDAYEAFGYVISQTTQMVSDFPSNPTFDIAPMLKDGTFLQHDHMWVSNTTTAVTMNGTATNDLLHGGSAGDTLNGNAGIDLLYGAAGNDTLNGGDGDDYLFGGSHNDVLNGGNGNDFLRGGGGNDAMTGGVGVDTFSVDIREKAANTITDFQIGTDKIEVAHAYGANATTLIQQILAGATTDGSGNVVLHLASGNDLTLQGIHAGQLTAASLFVSQ